MKYLSPQSTDFFAAVAHPHSYKFMAYILVCVMVVMVLREPVDWLHVSLVSRLNQGHHAPICASNRFMKMDATCGYSTEVIISGGRVTRSCSCVHGTCSAANMIEIDSTISPCERHAKGIVHYASPKSFPSAPWTNGIKGPTRKSLNVQTLPLWPSAHAPKGPICHGFRELEPVDVGSSLTPMLLSATCEER